MRLVVSASFLLLLLAACARAGTAPGDAGLARALEAGDAAALAAALAGGANPNGRTGDGTPFLVAAIFRGDVPATRALLAHGADPDTAHEGESALLLAAYGPDPLGLALLDHGARLRRGEDARALAGAATSAPGTLARLLETGVDPTRGAEEDDPLAAACEAGRLDAYRRLRRAGAEPRPSALIEAAIRSDAPAMVDAILAEFPESPLPEGWLASVVGMDSAEPLRPWIERWIAARGRPAAAELDDALGTAGLVVSPDLVELLLGLGANAGASDASAGVATGLDSAREERGEAQAFADAVACLDLLRAAGADPDAPNYEGRPALAIAVEDLEVELVAALLERGADPNGTTARWRRPGLASLAHSRHDGFAALLASEEGREPPVPREPRVAELLIDAGAEIDRRDERGRTALHHAAREAKPALVARLLEAGADRSLRDLDGQTPADGARSRLPRMPGEDDPAARAFVAVSGLGGILVARQARYAEILSALGEPLPASPAP